MKPLFCSVFVALIASLLSPVLRAQLEVTWTAPTAVSGPGDLVSTGTLLSALTGAATSVTISGVTFETSPSGITLNLASVVSSYTPGSYSSGNANYDALLNRGFFTAVNGTGKINFNGLTAGNVYRVQLWTPAWDANYATVFSSPANDTVQMGNTATQPTYVTGTFTAQSSSEFINFAGYGGSTRGLLAAATVYDVTAIPEPSTYAALAGLGALGLAWWRRSRRAR